MSHATIQSQWQKSEYVEATVLHPFLLKAYQFYPTPNKVFLFSLNITLSKPNYIRKCLLNT